MQHRIIVFLIGFFCNFNAAWAQAGEEASSGGFGFIDYAVIFVYFAALVWMGFYFSRREKNTASR